MVTMLKQSREAYQRRTRNAGGSKASCLTEELEAREKQELVCELREETRIARVLAVVFIV
jgi:transposase-like protein